jgi:hypothetical protein
MSRAVPIVHRVRPSFRVSPRASASASPRSRASTRARFDASPFARASSRRASSRARTADDRAARARFLLDE